MEEKKSKGDSLAMTTPLVPNEEEIQNFIEGNLYEDDDGVSVYLGKQDCTVIDRDGSIEAISDDSQIFYDEVPFIKKSKCHVFQEVQMDGTLLYIQKFLLSDERLKKLKNRISVDFSKLSTHKVDIQEYEQSSEIILKNLFIKTYYQENTYKIKVFNYYSRQIGSHKFALSYISRDGNTFINPSDLHLMSNNEKLLDVLNTTPKAESDFYVFRGGRVPRTAYEYQKIISGKVTEEKMFGSISTTILSSFAWDWIGKNTCCIYLIRVPKEENYLILDDVFNDELELNDKSQYEVTLAPGKIIFRDINQITINGSKVVLFVCDYKSFTLKEFTSGFKKPIYTMKDEPEKEETTRKEQFKEFKSRKYRKIYYLNTVTNKTSWGLPTYEDEETLLPIGWERIKSINKKPGYFYYYNNENKTVQWEDPKINSFSQQSDGVQRGPTSWLLWIGGSPGVDQARRTKGDYIAGGHTGATISGDWNTDTFWTAVLLSGASHFAIDTGSDSYLTREVCVKLVRSVGIVNDYNTRVPTARVLHFEVPDIYTDNGRYQWVNNLIESMGHYVGTNQVYLKARRDKDYDGFSIVVTVSSEKPESPSHTIPFVTTAWLQDEVKKLRGGDLGNGTYQRKGYSVETYDHIVRSYIKIDKGGGLASIA